MDFWWRRSGEINNVEFIDCSKRIAVLKFQVTEKHGYLGPNVCTEIDTH